MKVGIITWWRNNYGSILQALALQQKMNQYNDLQYEIICQFGKKATSVDNVFDKIKSVGLAETCKRVFWKVAFKGLRLRNKKMQQFVDENLKVSNQQYNEHDIADSNKYYDTYICGSDQIWNPEYFQNSYMLDYVREHNIKKISYASSLGVSALSKKVRKKYRKL